MKHIFYSLLTVLALVFGSHYAHAKTHHQTKAKDYCAQVIKYRNLGFSDKFMADYAALRFHIPYAKALAEITKCQ